MRNLIVTACLATVLLSTSTAGAEPVTGVGAGKLGSQDAKRSAAADVPATEIEADIARVSETTRAAGLKTTSAAPGLTRTALPSTQNRLVTMTRLAPVRSAKGLIAGPPRTAASADVPVSVVTRTMTAAPRAVAVKRLAASSGPVLQAAGAKLSTEPNLKVHAQ